jgi:hypothetical protein
MELLIAFFVAIGLISSGDKLTSKQLEQIRIENHDRLSSQYGKQYEAIIGGLDGTEKD